MIPGRNPGTRLPVKSWQADKRGRRPKRAERRGAPCWQAGDRREPACWSHNCPTI